jgi:hypothetical protein
LFGLDFGGRRRQSLVGDARFTVRGMLSKLAYKVLVFFAAVHHCIYAQRWEGRGGHYSNSGHCCHDHYYRHYTKHVLHY